MQLYHLFVRLFYEAVWRLLQLAISVFDISWINKDTADSQRIEFVN